MKAPYHPAVLGFLLCALIAADAVVLADPGFGLLKKRKVTLQVRRPAAVRLANTSIAFRTRVANPAYAPVAAPLEARLRTIVSSLSGMEFTLDIFSIGRSPKSFDRFADIRFFLKYSMRGSKPESLEMM